MKKKIIKTERFLIILFAVFGFLLLSTTGNIVRAEEAFPQRTVTCLIGFAPGGGADLPVRALVEDASKALGQSIVVLNKPGGGSAVALTELKNAEPDGYTIGVLSTGGVISTHMRKVTYHPVNDFVGIIQHSSPQAGLVVRADSSFNTLDDLISYAKANPNKVKYSTAGPGTPQHLVMLMLADQLNIKWTHIPYHGGVQAITALLGGHVDCASQTGEWKQHVLSGRLRLLASYGNKRLESFPNVPTLVELGYKITAPALSCLVGPKGISEDRVKILHDAFYTGLDNPGFKNALDVTNQPLIYRNSEDLQAYIKEIYDLSGEIIKKHSASMGK